MNTFLRCNKIQWNSQTLKGQLSELEQMYDPGNPTQNHSIRNFHPFPKKAPPFYLESALLGKCSLYNRSTCLIPVSRTSMTQVTILTPLDYCI